MEQEIKELIVKTLSLEGLSPADIDSNAPLFGDGLSLDSIDALELGVAIQKTYGIKLEGGDAETKAAFASVSSLARFVQARRKS
ncbi:MAG: hypothetical protein RL095_72 [Verrucomicrobiota bacterium]|jgi:acyl carrier protein